MKKIGKSCVRGLEVGIRSVALHGSQGQKEVSSNPGLSQILRNSITWDGDAALGDGNPREVSFSRVLGSDDKS